MELSEIIIIAIGLSLDAFAVALGVGSIGRIKGHRGAVRLAFHFGLFQFMMPVIGWYSGIVIEPFVSKIDHWIAFILLSYVGAKMIWESYKAEAHSRKDPSKGKELVLLSVATSIDALVVGFSLAILRISIWYPGIIIGIVTAVFSILGIYLGKVIGDKMGRKMEFIGGLVIIGIGVRILLLHLI
jgi:putative Mn2+ efflux pump MntP